MHQVTFSDVTRRHLGRALAQQAAEIGDSIFLRFGEDSYSFAQANDSVNELAAGLAQQGIGVGDRVAFYMGNSLEVIFLALACNKLGAVWVPINTDYKGEWLLDTINSSDPVLLVTDNGHLARIADIEENLEVSRFIVHGDPTGLRGAQPMADLFISGAPEPDMSERHYGETCAVLWTSGTTGKAKGVMQSHNVWFVASNSANRMFSVGQGDVIYSVLPMYNSAAWVTSTLRALLAGLTLAIDPSFSVKNYWERVDYYGATQSFTLGAMHMFLWMAEARPDDAEHSLQKLLAIPMPAEVAAPFSDRFGVQLMPMGLGQSEAMTLLTHFSDLGVDLPPGSCGKPLDFLEVKLVNDAGDEVPRGEAGELWVRPLEPHVIFSGYLGNPEATAAAYEGEWYKTGDMLKQDAQGFFYFSDRKKDAVRYKGRNISTFEVEMAARKHPAISDCAAFGVPSEELASESEIKLNVILKPGIALEEEELARFINDNAPYFFVPRYIEFVTELPYTPTSKVQKFKLRAQGVTAATWDGNKAGFKVVR